MRTTEQATPGIATAGVAKPAASGRVLVVAAAWPPYQAPEADHALQEALHLAAEGLEVHVLTTSQRGAVRPPSIHVHPVTTWRWRDLPRIWRLIGRVRPDGTMIFFLGHLYHYSTLAIFLPTIAKLRSRGSRVITQFSALGAGAPDGDRPSLRFRRWLFRRLGRFRYGTLLLQSDRLLVMSREHERLMTDIHPGLAAKTDLAPPPPLFRVVPGTAENRALGRRRLGVRDDEFVFMYFSRLYPTKGIEHLLPAFARFSHDRPGVRLAVVGGFHATDAWLQKDDYPDLLARLEADLGLADRIVWSGEYEWDSTAPSEYLRAADVAVLPFDRGIHLYNSSFAAVAAHSVPAIAAIPPEGFEQGIAHDVNVYGIPPLDEDALVAAMERLYGDEALRQRLAVGLESLATTWFTWEGCIATIRSALHL